MKPSTRVYTALTAAAMIGAIIYSALPYQLPSFIPPPPEVRDDPAVNNNITLVGDYPNGYTVPATVQGTADNWVIIDASQAKIKCLKIYGTYIAVTGGDKTGEVTKCQDHAVFVNHDKTKVSVNGTLVDKYPMSGWYVDVGFLKIHNNDKRDTGGDPSKWPSGAKCEKDSRYVVFHDNDIYENYGEGIGCTMSSWFWGYGNRMWDNWSVAGAYIDQVVHGYFYNNDVWNTGKSGLSRFSAAERWNNCSGGGSEDYSMSPWFWTDNRFSDVVFYDNRYSHCKRIGHYNPTGAAASQIIVANNTFLDVPAPQVVIPGATVSGNIVVTPTAGTPGTATATFTPSRTYTVTYTRTATIPVSETPTFTPTSSRTATTTASVTFSPTKTPTRTLTPITPSKSPTPAVGQLCVRSRWIGTLSIRPSASMFNTGIQGMHISLGAIIPVEAIISNGEGEFAQINNRMYFALFLKSNGKTYAERITCP